MQFRRALCDEDNAHCAISSSSFMHIVQSPHAQPPTPTSTLCHTHSAPFTKPCIKLAPVLLSNCTHVPSCTFPTYMIENHHPIP